MSSSSTDSSSGTEEDWDGEDRHTPPIDAHTSAQGSQQPAYTPEKARTPSSSSSTTGTDYYPDGRKKLKGVVFDDSKNIYKANRWIAVVHYQDKMVEVARCSTAVSAALCHDYAQRRLFGRSAQTNFPENISILDAFRAYGRPHRNVVLQGYLNENDMNEVVEEGNEALLRSVGLPNLSSGMTSPNTTNNQSLKISSSKGTIAGTSTQYCGSNSNVSTSQSASDGADSLWALASQHSQRASPQQHIATPSATVRHNVGFRSLANSATSQATHRVSVQGKPATIGSAADPSYPSAGRFSHGALHDQAGQRESDKKARVAFSPGNTSSSDTTSAASRKRPAVPQSQTSPSQASPNDNNVGKPTTIDRTSVDSRRSKRQKVGPSRFQDTSARTSSSDDAGSDEERSEGSNNFGIRFADNSQAENAKTVFLQVKGPEFLGTAGGVRANGSTVSVFRGVSFCHRPQKCWLAQVYVDNLLKIIGYFSTEEAAANAYDNYLRNLGQSVAVNLPREGEECTLRRSVILDGLEAKRIVQRKLIEEYPSHFAREDPAIVATEFLYRCCTEVADSEKWYIKLPQTLRGRDFDELLTKLENNAADTKRSNKVFKVALREADELYSTVPALRSKKSDVRPSNDESTKSVSSKSNTSNDSSNTKKVSTSSSDSNSSSTSNNNSNAKKVSTSSSDPNSKKNKWDIPAVTNKLNRAYMCRMQVTSDDVSEIGSGILPVCYEHSAAAKEYSYVKRVGGSVGGVSSNTNATSQPASATKQKKTPLHRNFFPHATSHESKTGTDDAKQQHTFVYSPFHNHLAPSRPTSGLSELRMPIGYGPYDPITENGFGASPTYSKLPPRPWNLLPSHMDSSPSTGEKTNNGNDFVGTKRKICHTTKKKGWYAAIERAGVTRWLGPFKTEEQAAQAFDVACLLTQGSNARTNFSYDMHTFFRRELDAASKEIVPLDNPVDRYYDQLKDHKVSRLEACQLQLGTDVHPPMSTDNTVDPQKDSAGTRVSSAYRNNGADVAMLPSNKSVNECTSSEAVEYFKRLYGALRHLIVQQQPYKGVSLREDGLHSQSLWKAEGVTTKYFKSAKIAALAEDVYRLETYGENADLNYSETSRQQLLESSSSMQVDHPGIDLIDEQVVGPKITAYARKLIDRINATGYKGLWKEISNFDAKDLQTSEIFPDTAPMAATTEWNADDGCYNDGTIKRV